MKSKASLSLMELLVMVLIFALAAALCLQTFAKAQTISLETARQDEAVLLAQNGAELLKSGMAAPEVEALLSEEAHRVQIQVLPQEIAGLTKVQISIFWEDTEWYALLVGYPEVSR